MKNIKQIVKERDKDFKELREKIRLEEKCSWEEATDYACEAFDAMYGSYDDYNKEEVLPVDILLKRIKLMYRQFINTIDDFLDREYNLLYSLPKMSVDLIYKGKVNSISFEKNEKNYQKAINEIKNILLTNQIKEIYYGYEHYNGCENMNWCGYEIYLNR